MLKADTKEKLKKLGFDVDKLEAAIKSDKEEDITLPEGQLFTDDELTARDTAKLEEGKTLGKTDGETATRTAIIKEVGKKLGIDFKATRIGDMANEIKEKIDANADEKYKLEQNRADGFQKDLEAANQRLEQLQGDIKKRDFNSTLIKHFTPNSASGLSADDRLLLLQRDIEFAEVNGVTVAKKNGQVINDEKTHTPMSLDKVVKMYETERKWDAAEPGGSGGGRGGGNSGGGGTAGIKTLSGLKSQWEKDNPGKSAAGEEFMNLVTKVAGETPDFDPYA